MKTLMRAAWLTRGAVLATVAALALSSAVFGSAASAASVKLPSSGVETPSGGTVTETGSTLLYPLFNLWAGGYNTKYSSVTIQTAGTGSGTGISEAENGAIDIGASDAYLSPSVAQSSPDLKNIPLAISAQIVAYNVPGVTAHLKLSGKVLSAIYQGQITKWNASQIASLNPGVTLPSTPIVTLHRSDSSGDTFLFTTYLSKTDPSGWGDKIGFNTTVQWPAAPGAQGEMGNSGMVSGCKAITGLHRLRRHQLPDADAPGGSRLRATPEREESIRPTDVTGDRRRGVVVRQQDPGERHDLADLRPGQRWLPDHQLRVRHRVDPPVVVLGGKEHPLRPGVGAQQEVRHPQPRTCPRSTSSPCLPRCRHSRSSRS